MAGENYELDVEKTSKLFPKDVRTSFKTICKGIKDDTFFGDSTWGKKKSSQLSIKLSNDNFKKVVKNTSSYKQKKSTKDLKIELAGYTIKFIISSKTKSKNKKPSAASRTSLTESAVCVVTAFLLQKNRDLTLADLDDPKTVKFLTLDIDKSVDIGELDSKKGIEQILNFLRENESWFETTVTTAKILKKNLGLNSSHHFHRDSKFMNKIYSQALSHIKTLNKVGLRIGGDKWNPGDIWIAKGSGNGGFPATKDLTELNGLVLQKFNDSDIMGISLKKLGKNPTYQIYNLENQERNFFFKEVKEPAGDLMNSKDMYIVTQKNKALQIRTFDSNSDIQIEIKGSSAAGGKAGFGLVAYAIKKITGEKIPKYTVINKWTEAQKISAIKTYYKSATGSSITQQKITGVLKEQTNRSGKLFDTWSKAAQNDYWSSKIQALHIASIIKNHKKRNDIMTIIVSYAASLGFKDMFDASVYAKIY